MKRKKEPQNLAKDEMRMMRENRKELLGHHCAPHNHSKEDCEICAIIYRDGQASRATIECKHPGPPFKPHDCATQWQTHIAYLLLMIMTGLLCFVWGYGPKWLN